jgi:hypothetical protein
MNRDFEFKQLLRAYRAGVITEATFECEVSAMENGNGAGKREFCAMGKMYGDEREAVADQFNYFRLAEAGGEAGFTAWAKVCTTDCIRSGIRMIAEREAYHSRIFARRMQDLGLECKAEPMSAETRKFVEFVGDAKVSDNEKLLYLNKQLRDIDAVFKPFKQFAEDIKDDLESKELFKLYAGDEISSATWLNYACAALNAPAASASTQATQSASASMS